MAIILHIELTYFEEPENGYEFLEEYLFNTFRYSAITPQLHISGTVPGIYIDDQTGNSMLFDIMNYIIDESQIYPEDYIRDEWYICVIVGKRHMDNYLGVMFDFDSRNNSRNGCAVFEETIRNFANKHRVDFEQIFSRTLLHEIGHCLNQPHDKEIKLMSPTYELISSIGPPKWNQNIVYEFSAANWRYIDQKPEFAKPGGLLDMDEKLKLREEDTFADSTKYWGKSLKLTLKNSELEAVSTFSLGSNIRLMLVFENVSLRSIRIPLSLHQNDENLKISITDPEGISIPYRKPILGCGNSWESIMLRPREKRIISINLFFDSKGYLFKNPGTYLINCSFRKFGKQNIWYKSDTEELKIADSSPEKKSLFEKVFVPSFRKCFLLGGGYNPGFFKKCNNYLNNLALRESGFTVPIAWIYLHSLKNKVLMETDQSRMKNLRKKLLKVYAQLLQEETSKIRRGKLSYELQQLLESPKVKAKKLVSFIQPQDQEDYLNFKKMHISRRYSPKNRANYESKILK